MKKHILALLFIIPTASIAQTIIPRLGAAVSTVTYDPESIGDLKSRIGFTAGVGCEFSLFKIISLQPEINFIQKGFEIDQTEKTSVYESSFTRKIKVNYLEVPVLVKVKLGAGLTKFYLVVGPSIGYGLNGKINEKVKVNYFDSTPDTYETQERDVEFKEKPPTIEDYGFHYIPNRVDVGVQVGGGVELFGRVMIDIRYGIGLTQLYGDEDHLGADLKDVKNRVIQFSVGVPLKLF